MKQIALSLILTAGAFAAPAVAQNAPEPAAAATACPSTATLDDLIKALDDAVSGAADKDRACLKEVMLPDARLSPLTRTRDGHFGPHALTVDEWIEAVKKRGHGEFYERQVKVSSDTYGHIAHLWSTYEIRPTPDGKAQIRGINSIEAVNDGKRWRVLDIQWQAETPEQPVPANYLP